MRHPGEGWNDDDLFFPMYSPRKTNKWTPYIFLWKWSVFSGNLLFFLFWGGCFYAVWKKNRDAILQGVSPFISTLLGGDFWSSSQCLSWCSEAGGGGGVAEGQHLWFEGNVASNKIFVQKKLSIRMNPPSWVEEIFWQKPKKPTKNQTDLRDWNLTPQTEGLGLGSLKFFG